MTKNLNSNAKFKRFIFPCPFSLLRIGVSCDACLKGNFRGRRYKCLICYDYDLCAACYEEGATSTSHSVEHPMQCILTRADFEIYYGGEPSNGEQPQSFTCPYCKKMGFSDTGLYDHVSAEHTDTGLEVVCPVCAALPGGDPNLVTDDFAGHLTLEHRTGPRDLISFLISFFTTNERFYWFIFSFLKFSFLLFWIYKFFVSKQNETIFLNRIYTMSHLRFVMEVFVVCHIQAVH